MATSKAALDIGHIVRLHNELRDAFEFPGAVASFVNENTVVRAAATVERHLERRARRAIPVSRKKQLVLEDMLGNWPGAAASDWGDTCVRTLFVLRHFVVHLGGQYRPRRLRDWTTRNLLPAYQEFARRIPEARVRQGRPLCLAGKEVLEPLLRGCRSYWLSRRPARTGRARP